MQNILTNAQNVGVNLSESRGEKGFLRMCFFAAYSYAPICVMNVKLDSWIPTLRYNKPAEHTVLEKRVISDERSDWLPPHHRLPLGTASTYAQINYGQAPCQRSALLAFLWAGRLLRSLISAAPHPGDHLFAFLNPIRESLVSKDQRSERVDMVN
jgi:hypothetical protein